jgi:hypothetical protein
MVKVNKKRFSPQRHRDAKVAEIILNAGYLT